MENMYIYYKHMWDNHVWSSCTSKHPIICREFVASLFFCMKHVINCWWLKPGRAIGQTTRAAFETNATYGIHKAGATRRRTPAFISSWAWFISNVVHQIIQLGVYQLLVEPYVDRCLGRCSRMTSASKLPQQNVANAPKMLTNRPTNPGLALAFEWLACGLSCTHDPLVFMVVWCCWCPAAMIFMTFWGDITASTLTLLGVVSFDLLHFESQEMYLLTQSCMIVTPRSSHFFTWCI